VELWGDVQRLDAQVCFVPEAKGKAGKFCAHIPEIVIIDKNNAMVKTRFLIFPPLGFFHNMLFYLENNAIYQFLTKLTMI